MLHRLWFDMATSLPVKVELVSPRSDGSGVSTAVANQFQWNLALSSDFFEPKPPPGFTLLKP
jgi:outer membrane lipoprotein-sorting protein